MDSKTIGGILKRLSPYADSECMHLVRSLIEAKVEEIRVKNDTASSRDVLRNQGAIKHLQSMLKSLTQSVPKRTEFGAYEVD